MVNSKKTIIFYGLRGGGGQHLPGRPTFSRGGGVQMLISIETHITCDFGGLWTPYPRSGSAQVTRNTVLKIRIRSQMYGHLHVLHLILYLAFTASLYDGKYACGEIISQTHSLNS